MIHDFVAPPAAAAAAEGTAVAIGVFDGVHLGHQALLSEARSQARTAGLRSLAFTFDPHPAAVLSPARAPALIEPVALRLARLHALGLDAAFVQPFSHAFAAQTPEAFVRDVLVQQLRARHVVVGASFTFGRRQSGNVATLRQLGAALGFGVQAVEHVQIAGVEASSTQIRALVRAGDMPAAARLLGHLFELVGTVRQGAQRGRTLGFPTANLQPDNALQPAPGVYAAYSGIDAGPTIPSVINIGLAPTFGALPQARLEAHLLGYSGPHFYGSQLRVALLTRLRDERRFDGVEALRAQIQLDAAAAAAACLRSR